MPKSAVIPDDPTKGATDIAAANGINEELLKGYVVSIEEEDAAIEQIMRTAREACQPHKDSIRAIKKAAAEHQIPKEPLSAKIAERKDMRRAENRRSKLNEDQQGIFDEIAAKLGDLPLFQHLDG